MSDRHSRALDKVAAALAPAFETDDIELAKATIVACCKATRRVRAGKDSKTGAYQYDDEADFPVRLAAAAKILEWTLGKPVARTITANLTPNGSEPSAEKFMQDVLSDRDSVEALLDTLKKCQEAAAKAKPVDIHATRIPTNPKALR